MPIRSRKKPIRLKRRPRWPKKKIYTNPLELNGDLDAKRNTLAHYSVRGSEELPPKASVTSKASDRRL